MHRNKFVSGTGLALFLLLLCPNTGFCVHAGNAVFEQEDGVYLIQSAQDMRTLALLVNRNKEVEPGVAAHNASYRLTRDIDLSPYCAGEEGWEPIGYRDTNDDSLDEVLWEITEESGEGEDYWATYHATDAGYFNGTFDGGNHVVTGLYINRPEEQAQGLFGQRVDLRGSELSEEEQQSRETTVIKNLYIKDCDITGNGNVGGVIGGMWNFIQYEGGDLILENCHVTGRIVADGWAGGVAGSASTIKNSSFSGTVEASEAGGIAGEAYYIYGCAVHGTVDGYYNVGGVGGMACCVRNSYMTGSVTGYDTVGGITGMGACLTGCYTRADVTGHSRTGGLIGDIQSMAVPCPEGASTAATIQNCLMGGYRMERAESIEDADVYYTNDDRYNGYICGFPGVGIDDRVTSPFYYRKGLVSKGFDDGPFVLFDWNCKPCDCTGLEETDFKDMLGRPKEKWADVWWCAADYAWPVLSWEKDSRFGYTTAVTVQKGESLWKLADRVYGDGNFWTLIYEQNRECIGEAPGLIVPGMDLEAPVNASLAAYAAKGEAWRQEQLFLEEGQEQGLSQAELKGFYRRLLADDLWNGVEWEDYSRQITSCVIEDLDENGQKDMLVMAGEGDGWCPGVIWLYFNHEPACVLKDESAYEDDFYFGFGFWEYPLMADFDNDGNPELLLVIANGGSGGTGGHYMCLFRHVGDGWEECSQELPNDLDKLDPGLRISTNRMAMDSYEAYCPYLEESREFTAKSCPEFLGDLPAGGRGVGCNARGFYDFKCVKYEGKNALQCREYLCGEGGVVHYVGDAVFLLAWDGDGICRVADWWVEGYLE